MIKCIATDMDGTLLNSTAKKITNENRQAILEAQSQGIEVVITTGRSYDEVDYLLEESGLQCPVIGVNGAETRTKEGEISSTKPIGNRKAKETALKLLEKEVYFEIYTDKGKFTKNREKSISVILDIVMSTNPKANEKEILKFAQERTEKLHLIDNYEDLFVDSHYQLYKFLAFSSDDQKLRAVIETFSKMDELAISSSGHRNIEITDYLAQKGIALENFVKERSIRLEETMAIGDNYNDVSMFQRVGRAVAMGNAVEAIKKQCDYVTATNDEHGVAKAIWDVLRKNQPTQR